ncbi:MAG: diguanylate cyclase with sensor [Firmicutes bacterium]|nr:diguanylate cyclase with sensor [Bacillota bacterium]
MKEKKKNREQLIAEILNFQVTASILDHVSDLICVKDLDGRYVTVSESFADKLKVPVDDMIGKTVYDLFAPDIAEKLTQDDRFVLESRRTMVFSTQFNSDSYGILFFETCKSPVYDARGAIIGIVGVSRDITERERVAEHLRYLGYHDMLTGLYNRNYFETFGGISNSALEHPQEEKIVGLITFDIDGLKLVNDAMGHDAGDRRLKCAADLLKEAVGERGSLARIGGDEFAAIVPGATMETLDAIVNSIHELMRQHNGVHELIPLNIAIGRAIGDLAKINFNKLFKEADNAMYRDKMLHSQSSRNAIVKTVDEMLKARDFITEGHADRLQKLVVRLGKLLEFSEARLNDLRLLAQFHDVGKIGIPDNILFKPGPLAEEEEEIMQRHSEIGYHIAQSIREFASISEWVLKHHERWDGKGYPLGLSGEEIPLECRILLIADAYDAMTSDRPYRKALSQEIAVEELKKYSGSQFDPQMVQFFLQLLTTI